MGEERLNNIRREGTLHNVSASSTPSTTSTPSTKRQRKASAIRNGLLTSASALVIGGFATAAVAQDDEASEDIIVVTGIRSSLGQSADIKRNADGIVDAINAEDIGKFPDTNLAESLQRVTGVSINRVNGEGSLVTVRGFGPSFNLVTLNGRNMPTADVAIVGGDGGQDFATGASRSFDFSNLASEGVSALEVYKTGRASVPSGGIGATINIVTQRPLDQPGFRATIGGKAVFDTTVDRGSTVTPEVSGLLNWTDESERFGVALFGSFQQRDSAAVSATSAAWNVVPASQFLDPSTGPVTPATQLTNAPSDPTQLVSFPRDSRYHFREFERERINGSAIFQFRPVENFTLTADATYAQNQQQEDRADQSIWFNQPFNQVVFDQNQTVATTVFLQEIIDGSDTDGGVFGTKDIAFQQQFRATEDTLESFGINAEYQLNDQLTVSIDGHMSEAFSGPDAPNGTSSTLVGISAPVVAAHSVDYSGEIPIQLFEFNDVVRSTHADPRFGTNPDGVFDIRDVGTDIGRTNISSQEQDLDEVRFDARWDFNDNSSFQAGFNYRNAKMTQKQTRTQQTLGNWGVGNPGDVETFAPGMLEQFCLVCNFNEFDPGGASQVAFRGDAVELYNILSGQYASIGNAVAVTTEQFNVVEEEILSGYVQFSLDGEFMGRPASIVVGARYEDTSVEARSDITAPQSIIWQADNDFSLVASSNVQPVSASGDYNNLLPSADLSMEFMPDVIGRISFSKTIGRPTFNNLFVADSVNNNTPPGPTAFGNVPVGATGNPGLLPLESQNFDISLEWYYNEDSYVSLGFFDKRVNNFVGTGQSTRPLFDLRDPSSGLSGTRSGDALAELNNLGVAASDVNLFTMTALIDDNGGDVAAASAIFQANLTGGVLNQTFVDQTLNALDVVADSTDPLFQFRVTGPVNNREANVRGLEFAFQHFFGDTGFGVAGSYTYVDGDIGFDVGSNPNSTQFALVGLSDTANATLIYENYGFSARLAFNWREEFLSTNNRGGGFNNPVFVEDFGQLDLNVSYDVTENISLSAEAINLTEESIRTYARSVPQLWNAQEFGRRFLVGARYKF